MADARMPADGPQRPPGEPEGTAAGEEKRTDAERLRTVRTVTHSTPFRVLVTGSRDWRDGAAVDWALREATRGISFWKVTLVHGACPTGADAIADQWAAEREDITIERHPAAWRVFGPRAGIARNVEMVDLGADVCLAFLMPCRKPGCPKRPHDSHGASDCAERAEAAGIEVRRFKPC